MDRGVGVGVGRGFHNEVDRGFRGEVAGREDRDEEGGPGRAQAGRRARNQETGREEVDREAPLAALRSAGARQSGAQNLMPSPLQLRCVVKSW